VVIPDAVIQVVVMAVIPEAAIQVVVMAVILEAAIQVVVMAVIPEAAIQVVVMAVIPEVVTVDGIGQAVVITDLVMVGQVIGDLGENTARKLIT
jgi:hypothetical protein